MRMKVLIMIPSAFLLPFVFHAPMERRQKQVACHKRLASEDTEFLRRLEPPYFRWRLAGTFLSLSSSFSTRTFARPVRLGMALLYQY